MLVHREAQIQSQTEAPAIPKQLGGFGVFQRTVLAPDPQPFQLFIPFLSFDVAVLLFLVGGEPLTHVDPPARGISRRCS